MGNMMDDLLYSLGSKICHQMPERSFFIGGHQLFVASRDTGIYLGFLMAIGIIFLLREMENRRGNFRLICALMVPLAIDGLGVLFKFWESDNSMRLNSGLLGGISMAYLIAYAYPYPKREGMLPSLKGLALSLFGAMLVYFSFFLFIPRFGDTPFVFELVNFLVFAGVASMLASIIWLFYIILNRKGM